MNIRYENDREKGAGFGLFHIDSVDIPASSPVTFSIQRSSDGKYLGNATWLDAEERLKPLEITHANASCTLHVAQNVINHLDNLESYRFTLVAEGFQKRAVLSIADTIIYGGTQQAGHIQAASAVPPAPVPAPVPTPVPAPVIPQPVAVAPVVAAAAAAVAPVAIAAGLSVVRMALIALGGLIVLGIGTAAILIFLQKIPNPFAGALDAIQQEAPVLSPKAQVNDFVNKNGSPEEAFALANTMPSTEEGHDARFLLLEIAAEGGIVEATMLVAEIYDPNLTAPTGTLMKDAEQAHYWYDQVLASPSVSPDLRKQAEAAKGKLPSLP